MAQKGADSVAIVDIGTSKICCLIAAIDSMGDVQITGVGHLGSAGIDAGLVQDIKPAQSIISRVVQQAETMAGHVVEQVVVVNSGGHLGHDAVRVEVSAAGHAIERGDIATTCSWVERYVGQVVRCPFHQRNKTSLDHSPTKNYCSCSHLRTLPPPKRSGCPPQKRLEERIANLEVELAAIREYQENSEVYQQTVRLH